MGRILAGTGVAVIIAMSAAAPAAADPLYPPTTPPEVSQTVTPSQRVLPRADPGDPLPRTGAEIATAAGVGVLLLGGGALLLRVSRKGRHAG